MKINKIALYTGGPKKMGTSVGMAKTPLKSSEIEKVMVFCKIVKLRQGSGKDRQGMALKAKGLKA